MDALYSHTAQDAAAFASSYYGFAENLTQEVVCDAGDVVIFTEALTQCVVPLALSVLAIASSGLDSRVLLVGDPCVRCSGTLPWASDHQRRVCHFRYNAKNMA